jgi:hypothetical protein
MRVNHAVMQVAKLASGLAVIMALGGCDGRAPAAPSVPVPNPPSGDVPASPWIPVAVKAVLLTPPTDVVVARTRVEGMVVLNMPAPAAGAKVALSSSEPRVSVETNLLVPAVVRGRG